MKMALNLKSMNKPLCGCLNDTHHLICTCIIHILVISRTTYKIFKQRAGKELRLVMMDVKYRKCVQSYSFKEMAQFDRLLRCDFDTVVTNLSVLGGHTLCNLAISDVSPSLILCSSVLEWEGLCHREPELDVHVMTPTAAYGSCSK